MNKEYTSAKQGIVHKKVNFDSEEETPNIIADVLKEIKKHRKTTLINKKYEHLTVLIGKSGSGKSTLINFIAEHDLRVAYNRDQDKVYIKNHSEKGAEIGHTSQSKTYVPEVYTIKGIDYCDMPGFGDSRGDAVEVAKSFFMKSFLESANNIRFIITINYSDTDNKVESLKKFIKDFIKLIPNLKEDAERIINSMLIVMTFEDSSLKTDTEKIDNAYNRFQRIAKECNESDDAKRFLELIKKERIVIFRQPKNKKKFREKPLREIKIKIKKKQVYIYRDALERINNITEKTPYLLRNTISINHSIDDKTILKLVNNASVLKRNTSENLGKVFSIITKHYDEQITNTKDIYALNNILTTDNWSDLKSNDWTTFLNKLKGCLVDKYKSIDFQKYIQEIELQDELLQFVRTIDQKNTIKPYTEYKNIFSTFYKDLEKKNKWNNILINVCEIPLTAKNLASLKKFSTDKKLEGFQYITSKAGKIAALSFAQKKQLKEILTSILTKQKIKKSGDVFTIIGHIVHIKDVLGKIHIDKPKNIWVFASKEIILDGVDVNAHSANFTLIAPQLRMFGTNKMNLNGTDGKEFKPSKAKNGESSDVKGADVKGADGKPGLPGNSSGNFLAIHSRVINAGGLSINLNGGKGGKGQDGGDGHKGSDGRDAINYPGENDKYEQDHGEGDRVSREYGSEGMKGGNGGKGGVQGNFGLTGNLYCYPSSVNIKQIERKKEDRIDGKGGKGGKGGKSGKDKTASCKSVQNAIMTRHSPLTYRTIWYSNTRKKVDHDPLKAEDGIQPTEKNKEGITSPTKIKMEWYKPIVAYKAVMYGKLEDKYFSHSIKSFFKLLNKIQKNDLT